MASKISVSDLIGLFQTMYKEHWKYTMGAAERGNVDCSGAFVWAYRQLGKSIYHGSNRMARVEVEQLIPISGAKIVPGMAAFKCHKPGEAGYDLPNEYKAGGAQYNGDLNDYYHVGLIGADGATVLNAQSTATGFMQSPITQNWSHVAYLKQVDYAAGNPQPDEEAPADTPQTATVWAANGNPVKMRNLPLADNSKTAWDWVPVGTSVTVRGPVTDGWTPIRYNGKDGYMMAAFLRYGEADDDPGEKEDGSTYTLSLRGLDQAKAEALAALYPQYKPTITKEE